MSKTNSNNGTAFLEGEMGILNQDFSQITALAIIAYQRADREHDECLYHLLGAMVDTLFNAKSRMIRRIGGFIEQEDEKDE